MNKNILLETIERIKPLNEKAMQGAADHLDRLTKPKGSLGKLEKLAVQLAGITGEVKPSFAKRAVIVMAGDHGVVEEGVTAYPAEVTPQMVLNFLEGGATVNVLSRQAGADVFCVDIGVNADLTHPKLISRKVRRGTANIAKGPAMTRAEAEQAIIAGIETVNDCIANGYTLFVTGEMGIGNTTTSSALVSAFTGLSPNETVGRGTGVNDAILKHKVKVVQKALDVNKPDINDPIDVLMKIGGLEIAGLVGVILGSASQRCPVVIDGFISSAAALIAKHLSSGTVDYMIGSHFSHEQGHALVIGELGLSPMLHMDMRVGEGTGGVMNLHLVDAICRIMSEMATFESAGVSDKE